MAKVSTKKAVIVRHKGLATAYVKLSKNVLLEVSTSNEEGIISVNLTDDSASIKTIRKSIEADIKENGS